MRFILKILLTVTLIISTTSYSLPQCPSTSKVRNAVLLMASLWGTEWLVLSGPITSEDQSNWVVGIDITGSSLKTSEEILKYARNKIKTVPLTYPQPTKQSTSTECWYTDDIAFQVVAASQNSTISPKTFS